MMWYIQPLDFDNRPPEWALGLLSVNFENETIKTRQ